MFIFIEDFTHTFQGTAVSVRSLHRHHLTIFFFKKKSENQIFTVNEYLDAIVTIEIEPVFCF